ncbi:MAG: hypothetical protein IT385_00985 [Deltaproteobacteria bacterium]|nr:hypothetical protein [Deltaproteobacteria bacterium]
MTDAPTPESRGQPGSAGPSAEGRAALLHMTSGYAYTWLVVAAARLGVADALAGGPLDAATLAARLRADPDHTRRLAHALAAMGLLDRRGDTFALNGVSRWLRRDVPDSALPHVLVAGAPEIHLAWARAAEAVRYGAVGFELAHGDRFFEHLDHAPELRAAFLAAGRGEAAWEEALAEACPLAGARTALDLGGGDGALLDAIARAHPHVRATLLERASVVPHLRHDRPWDVVVGDFTRDVPAGFDVYLMRRVLHDHDDAGAARILTNVRRALGAGGRALALEYLRAPGREAATAMLDMTMVVLTGGRERSEEEHRVLFEGAGLALEDVITTPVGMSILVARAGP